MDELTYILRRSKYTRSRFSPSILDRNVPIVFRRRRGIEVGEASNWLEYIVATTSFDHLESFPQWPPTDATLRRQATV